MARLLDTAAMLVDELGPDAVTTTLIAERAGVSVGWLYDFFDDRQAVFDAVILRCIDQFADLIDRTHASQDFPDWRAAVGAVIDAFTDFYRTQPGFRAIWFSPYLNDTMLEANRVNDEALWHQALHQLRRLGLVPEDVDLDLAMQMVTAIIDKGLDVAFRRTGIARAAVIAETKVAVDAYLSHYLP